MIYYLDCLLWIIKVLLKKIISKISISCINQREYVQ
jgi:hypothetical protein